MNIEIQIRLPLLFLYHYLIAMSLQSSVKVNIKRITQPDEQPFVSYPEKKIDILLIIIITLILQLKKS